MNIGKAAPPQTLPISASIPLSSLPTDRASLTAWCETLETYDLLKNAVGISMSTLYLTAHLGSEEIRNQLTQYGFDIQRQQVSVYVLSKNHDTTAITPKTLCEELSTMRSSVRSALSLYDAVTDMASIPGILDDRLSSHLMRLIVPSHTLSLAAVFPAGVTLSFDTLFLGSYAKGQSLHQRSLEAYLQQETGHLNDAVCSVFPDLGPAFKIWSASYSQYLLERIKQPDVAEDVVAQMVAITNQAKKDLDGARATPASEHSVTDAAPPHVDAEQPPVETLKSKMDRLRTFAGLQPEDGPLTRTPEVDHRTTHEGVVLVRRLFPSIQRAWQIPYPPSGDEMVSIPHWAMLCSDWDFSADQGSWLVFNGSEVELLSNDEFDGMFEITE